MLIRYAEQSEKQPDFLSIERDCPRSNRGQLVNDSRHVRNMKPESEIAENHVVELDVASE